MLCFLFVFQLADGLSHGAHGAEGAPAAGLEKYHHDEADEGGGEHQAVEAKAKLGNPVGHGACGVGPAPGNTDCPKQFDGFLQGGGSRSHQIGLKNDVAEHGQKENQKAVAEPLGRKPFGCGAVGGAMTGACAPASQTHGRRTEPASLRHPSRHSYIGLIPYYPSILFPSFLWGKRKK